MKKPVLIVIVILLALILLAGLAFILAMENREVPSQNATQGQTGENAGNDEQPGDSQSTTGDVDTSNPESTESDDLPMMTRPLGGNQSGNTTDETEPTAETSDTEATDPDGTETTEDDSGLDEDELPYIPR